MSFSMSHLYIAQQILKNNPQIIKDISQYYLGSLAPDAVYFRKSFNATEKSISHFYIHLRQDNLEEFIENWKTNVKLFFSEHKSQNMDDFLLGYCIHLMTDIYNHKYIVKPFILHFKNKDERERTTIYQNECLSVDFEIFQKNKELEEILSIINRSNSIDFYNLISREELEKMKDHVVNKQYKNIPKIDTSKNEYIKYEKMMEENNNTIEYIKKEFMG
jgi:hypothetical protein